MAALAHHPVARFAMLSQRLRGVPFMTRPPLNLNGHHGETFRHNMSD
ncbi:hypothetical protein [Microvirga sp. 2TAF3]